RAGRRGAFYQADRFWGTAQRNRHAGSTGGMSARILVVDDEPDLEALVLQKFRQQIRDGAIEFLFARDGVEALTALKANGGIGLVVTDINMPRMDGLALLQKLQDSDENISTIVHPACGEMRICR